MNSLLILFLFLVSGNVSVAMARYARRSVASNPSSQEYYVSNNYNKQSHLLLPLPYSSYSYNKKKRSHHALDTRDYSPEGGAGPAASAYSQSLSSASLSSSSTTNLSESFLPINNIYNYEQYDAYGETTTIR